jgi:glycosyltransferase involved in cell wall biosynthesis
MNIAIIADGKEQEGGTKEVICHIKSALKDNRISVEYVNEEKYLPKFFPVKWKNMFRFFYLRKISKIDFSQYDITITLQPDSHCARHRNHIVYFQHHKKEYYDLFSVHYRSKASLRKKIIFLLLAAITRISDRFYLTPNLKQSSVIVNSPVVGDRLKKYNNMANFAVIYPGCDGEKEHPATTHHNTTDDRMEKNKTPALLAFSRLNVVQKGIDTIVSTALVMPNYRFIVAGPYDNTIDYISKEDLPANVQIVIKEFSKEEKHQLFLGCDVFLAPYIEEDFGITPLEANAIGKPVVYCDDSGGITYTQKHLKTGFMCKRNPADIAKGIEFCMENKESMKQACIDNSSNYSWASFEKHFSEFVRRLSTKSH